MTLGRGRGSPHRLKWWHLLVPLLLLVVPVNATGAGSNTTVIRSECIRAYWPTLASRCQAVQRGTGEPGDVASTVMLMLSSCIQDTASAGSKVANLLAPQLFYLPSFLALIQAYTERSSTSVSVTGVPFTDWGNILIRMSASKASLYGNTVMHGYILDNVAMGSLNQAMLLADLTGLILTDSNLQWLSIHSFYRNTVITQAGLISAVPIGGLVYQMYYREDVLAAFNLTVPNTWEDLLTAVALVHNQPYGKTNSSVAGICLQRARDCFGGFTLTSIWAPMAVHMGASQGGFFDANTMQHQMGTAAMKRAMEIYVSLGQYAHPATKNLCFVVDNVFLAGKCAFGFGWPGQFKANSLSPQTKVASTARISMMPGSTQVFDRSTQQLTDCTPSLCPYARTESVGYGASQGQALVNRAPFMPLGSVSAGISPSAPFALQQLLFGVFSYIGGPSGSWKLVLNPITELGPFRVEHFDPLNIPRWTAAGYDGARTWEFLSGILAGLDHPNVVAEPRVPVPANGRNAFRQLLNAATNGLDWAPNITTAFHEIKVTLEGLSRTTEALYGPAAPGFDACRTYYRFSVGWKAPAPPPMSAFNASISPEDEKGVEEGGLSRGTLTAIIACAVLGLLVVLLLVAACLYRSAAAHQQHKASVAGGAFWQFFCQMLLPANLVGPVLPPGKGPDTSLVVTDVEKSTELWEALDPAVMDVVWNLHHGCMRVHASKYRGYESQTEGDSFIIGFESAELALRFCLDVQRALVELDWPQALLSHPLCCPQWSMSIKKRPTNRPAQLPGKRSSFKLEAAPASAFSSIRRHEPRRVVQRVRDMLTSMLKAGQGPSWTDSLPQTDDVEPELGEGWGLGGMDHMSMSRYLVSLAGGATQASEPSDSIETRDSSKALVLGSSTLHPHALKPFSAAQVIPGDTPGLSASTSCPAPPGQDTEQDLESLMRGMASGVMSSKSQRMQSRASHHASSPRIAAQLGSHTLEQRLSTRSRGNTSVCSNPGSSVHKSARSYSAGNLVSSVSTKASRHKNSWRTLHEVVRGMWAPCTSDSPGAVLIWRGLKVRMGVATGMHLDTDLVYNEAAGRHKYSGSFLSTCRAISHVAHGGQVVLSQTSLEQTPAAVFQDRRQRCILVYMGEYELEECDDNLLSMYTAMHNWALPRICEWRPLRAHRLALGALDAPTGHVAYACMKVVGSEVMQAAGGLVYQEVFSQLHELLLHTAAQYGGFITQGARRPGMSINKLSCAFKSAHAALCWALEMQRCLRWHTWSPAVLQDPHCEEITVGDGDVVFRGPRCKAVVVYGEVGWRLDEVTGTIMYHGEAIQSLHQLMRLALTGMVVASPAAAADAKRHGGRLVSIQQSSEHTSQTGAATQDLTSPNSTQGHQTMAQSLSVAYSSDATSRSTNPKRTTSNRPGFATPAIREVSESGAGLSFPDRALAALRSLKGSSHSAPGNEPAQAAEPRLPAGLHSLLLSSEAKRPASDTGSPSVGGGQQELIPSVQQHRSGQGHAAGSGMKATTAPGVHHHSTGSIPADAFDTRDSSHSDAMFLTASSAAGTAHCERDNGNVSAPLPPSPLRLSAASSAARFMVTRGATTSGASVSHQPQVSSRLSSMRKNASFTTIPLHRTRPTDHRASDGALALPNRAEQWTVHSQSQLFNDQKPLSTATSSPLPTQPSQDAHSWEQNAEEKEEEEEEEQDLSSLIPTPPHASYTDISASAYDGLMTVQEVNEGEDALVDESGTRQTGSLRPAASHTPSALSLQQRASRGAQTNPLYQQPSHTPSSLSTPRTSTMSFTAPDDLRAVYINVGHFAPDSPRTGVPVIPEAPAETGTESADCGGESLMVTATLPALLGGMQAINLSPVQLFPKSVSAIGMRKGVLMYMATFSDGDVHQTQTQWVLHDSRPSPPSNRPSAWRKSLNMFFGSNAAEGSTHGGDQASRLGKPTQGKRAGQAAHKPSVEGVTSPGRPAGARDTSFDGWATRGSTPARPSTTLSKQTSRGSNTPTNKLKTQAKLVPIAIHSASGAAPAMSHRSAMLHVGSTGSFTRASADQSSRTSWMSGGKPRMAWLQQLFGDEGLTTSKQGSFNMGHASEGLAPVQRKVSFSTASTAGPSSGAQPSTYQPAVAPERSAMSRSRLERGPAQQASHVRDRAGDGP